MIFVLCQLELHLYNPDHKLVKYLKSKGIVPEAYSPLGSAGSPLLDDEVAVEVASKHKLKPADVLLAWLRMSYVHFVLTRKPGFNVSDYYYWPPRR